MALPDGLTEQQLAEHGFRVVEEKRAKHERYNSYRNKCDRCEKWYKTTTSGKDNIHLCRKCSRKSLMG